MRHVERIVELVVLSDGFGGKKHLQEKVERQIIQISFESEPAIASG